MAVDDRAARTPQAVPHAAVVGRGRVLGMRAIGPGAPGGEEVVDEVGVEGERVVVVEDEDRVVRIGQAPRSRR